MLDVYENREKQQVYPVCIDKKTRNGASVRTFATEFFGDVPYLFELIEACHVLFNQRGFNRKDRAIKNGFVLEEDFTINNDIMLFDIVKLKHLFKMHPDIIPDFKKYINSFNMNKTSKTISSETNRATLDIVKSVIVEIEPLPEYNGDLVSSIRSNCLFGFIPQNELFEIIKKENPAYLLEKNKANKYTFADGKLMITLW